MAIFATFFFGNFSQEGAFYHNLKGKKRFSRPLKQEVQKVEKLTFFKVVNPCFWSKNEHCSIFVFLGNIGQENLFYDILERKNTFLGHKDKKYKK